MPKTNCECEKGIKSLADTLISANTNWTEDDREYLQKQSEEKLKKFVAMQTEEEVVETPAPKVEEEEVVSTNNTPAPKKVIGLKEYIENSPPEIREMMLRGLQSQENEKKHYTELILANESNEFTKEELATMKPDMLKKLAGLANEQKKEVSPQVLDLFSHIGQVGAPQHMQTNNEEALPLPTMSFAKK